MKNGEIWKTSNSNRILENSGGTQFKLYSTVTTTTTRSNRLQSTRLSSKLVCPKPFCRIFRSKRPYPSSRILSTWQHLPVRRPSLAFTALRSFRRQRVQDSALHNKIFRRCPRSTQRSRYMLSTSTCPQRTLMSCSLKQKAVPQA